MNLSSQEGGRMHHAGDYKLGPLMKLDKGSYKWSMITMRFLTPVTTAVRRGIFVTAILRFAVNGCC
jgi:hypothetical protein